MNRRFGTDGIRGVANSDLRPEFALALGRALAQVLAHEPERTPIIVGRDTRCSGTMLEGAFIAGVLSTGFDVDAVGIAPTPAIALITSRRQAAAGVMISASHNPIEDNGFKIFDCHGTKFSQEREAAIEYALQHDQGLRPTHTAIGTLRSTPDYLEEYLHALTNQTPSLTGLTVVLDAAHGAAWDVGPRAFTALGVRVIALNATPDGAKINVACGATDLRMLENAVRDLAAQGTQAIGVAFDGDADRVLFVDEHGTAVDGDAIILAIARDLYHNGDLVGSTVVGTVMSNLAYEHELQKIGIRLLRTPVGDRHILECLKLEGAILGGEPSGHLIDLRKNPTGDGPATAIAVLSLLQRERVQLSELARAYTPFPQILMNVRVNGVGGVAEHPLVIQASAQAQTRLGNFGRLLIRPSGTEPVVRVMVEGEDAGLVHELATSLAQTVQLAANLAA